MKSTKREREREREKELGCKQKHKNTTTQITSIVTQNILYISMGLSPATTHSTVGFGKLQECIAVPVRV